ncbi:MAG: hypothetical protein FWF80_02595 [Defluviitaleaceae bacterium]|nr:hypothetical protein [Defluviitaleaceae bacterium]
MLRQILRGKGFFDEFDFNQDGYIDRHDFSRDVESLFVAIERGYDDLIRNYYGLFFTSAQFLEHFSLRSNAEVLRKLDLPIYIFHGTHDTFLPWTGVLEIHETFNELGKTNLTVDIFPEHNNWLNFSVDVFRGIVSEGRQSVIDAIAQF